MSEKRPNGQNDGRRHNWVYAKSDSPGNDMGKGKCDVYDCLLYTRDDCGNGILCGNVNKSLTSERNGKEWKQM